MSDWHSFEGTIEPMVWGEATYTVLRLPSEVAEALRSEGATRVEGEFGEHPVNLALSTAPVIDGVFLWAGKTLLEAAMLQPGQPFHVRLRKTDPNVVEVPDDVRHALRSAGVTEAWEDLTPGKRRGLLHLVETAKREKTRAKRISALIRSLDDSD